jgi:hypothetical protein
MVIDMMFTTVHFIKISTAAPNMAKTVPITMLLFDDQITSAVK